MTDDYIEGLWARGVSFSTCAQRLATIAKTDAEERGVVEPDKAVFNGDHSVSIHLLSGFALELMLKVGYLLRGGERKQLDGAIRHDLREALDHAERRGFRADHPRTRAVVESLRDTHRNHHFRYGERPKVTLPALHETFSVLNALYRQLAAEIYSETPVTYTLPDAPKHVS